MQVLPFLDKPSQFSRKHWSLKSSDFEALQSQLPGAHDPEETSQCKSSRSLPISYTLNPVNTDTWGELIAGFPVCFSLFCKKYKVLKISCLKKQSSSGW